MTTLEQLRAQSARLSERVARDMKVCAAVAFNADPLPNSLGFNPTGYLRLAEGMLGAVDQHLELGTVPERAAWQLEHKVRAREILDALSAALEGEHE